MGKSKFVIGTIFTVIIGLIMYTYLGYIGVQRTSAQLEMVRQNMGDQVALQSVVNMWNVYWFGSLVVGIILIVLIWLLLFRKEVGQMRNSSLLSIGVLVIASLILSSCSYGKAVIVTPPNYGIVVNMENKTDQATGNSFADGELMNVTKISIQMTKCAVDSGDMCPNVIVAEVQGSPESRIYTKDPNTGTSSTNQSLCFEAKGANGCLDFSVTAIILRENARCYANKMGVKPVTEEDGKVSRYHFVALPLAEALDTRVIQIAGSQNAKSVANISPLKLALDKFELFDKVKPTIVKVVLDQTCISITDLSINGGVEWDSPTIQDQIDQATVLANQLELVAQQNDLLAIQTKAFKERALELEKQFGLAAAVEFMKIMKWDGTSLLPFLPQQPALEATPENQPVVQPTAKP